ncbi:hypothetical protein QA612_07155 [Evansella sp. AB-P1]|uniref:hypothetical protein n=1 Tax=Evansella sp. AB-P1 TaxID=3037653 RepID=UPI00241D61A6|nr:hypothetical protein [Evansella sp. AB-P1]MDG5787267.1 hypothetical protein [Evansella sp. AB-P1]
MLKILGVVCYLTALLYLGEHFISSDLLTLIYSLLGGILFVFTLFYIRTLNRVIVLSLVIIGLICFYIENISYKEAVLGFGQNINLLTLFLLVPLIGTFMSTSGYLTALNEKVQVMEGAKGSHPYRNSFFLAATMGLLLNLGSMAIVKRISEESFTSYRNLKLTLTIMRGFAMCMFWSPYFVNVALILVLFDLSWLDIGAYGISLALVYLLVCWIMFKRIAFPDDPVIENNGLKDENTTSKSLVPFYLFCVVLISMSFIFEYVLDVNMTTIVSLLALILPMIWAIFTNIIKFYIQDVSFQVQTSFFRMRNELAVFISAGFIGLAITETNVGALVSHFLFQASYGSVYVLTLLIVLLSILLSFLGIHPVIIVIGIGSALSPAEFGVSPEYFAVVFLISWAMATQISPFSGQLLMAAQLMGKPTTTIVKHNYQFVIILTFLLSSVAYSFFVFGLI